MASTASGVYFDGQTSRRQDVHVELADGLRIIGADGRLIAVWAYDDLREVAGRAAGLRLTLDGGWLARLEIAAGETADEIRRRAPKLALGERAEKRLSRAIVGWSFAAVASLLGIGLYGIPALADRLAPMLPWSVDVRMGSAVDAQLRQILRLSAEEPFECGAAEKERPGRAALDALAKTLSDAAGLPVPVRIVAVRSDIVNAVALPGGTIFLFNGLIDSVAEPDELAGVLAHEIGHVAARDGSRRALQSGGVSLLLGFFVGDFVGGAATVAVATALSQASYSRHSEAEADQYAIGLMKKIGADPKALGELLVRMSGDADASTGAPLDYLASHPATGERRAAIAAASGTGPFTPSMDREAFRALKRICEAKP